MSEVVRFERVVTRRDRYGVCPVCEHPNHRKRSFTATVSPLNRDESGVVVRSTEQVVEWLNGVADAWVPDFTHQRCQP